MKLFSVSVEQEFRVIDRLEFLVRADNIGDAIKLVDEGQGNLCHSDELEREGGDLYIDTAVVEEVEEDE